MSERHLELMQHHDGELPENPEFTDDDRAVLDGLTQLSECVNVWAEDRSAGAGDIADLVMSRLDEAPRLRVVAQGEAPGAAVALAPVAPPAQERDTLPPASTAARRGGRAFVYALSAAAAAALLIRLATSESVVADPPRTASIVEVPVVTPAPRVEEEPVVEDPAAEIESIDFGAKNGTIFLVSAGTETTPVVWLSEDVAESGMRTEPL